MTSHKTRAVKPPYSNVSVRAVLLDLSGSSRRGKGLEASPRLRPDIQLRALAGSPRKALGKAQQEQP